MIDITLEPDFIDRAFPGIRLTPGRQVKGIRKETVNRIMDIDVAYQSHQRSIEVGIQFWDTRFNFIPALLDSLVEYKPLTLGVSIMLAGTADYLSLEAIKNKLQDIGQKKKYAAIHKLSSRAFNRAFNNTYLTFSCATDEEFFRFENSSFGRFVKAQYMQYVIEST